MFWKRKKKPELEINRIVRELAECLLQPDKETQFSAKAKELSEKISISQLESLSNLLHNPPTESNLFSTEEHGLGGWLSCCQFAIFELVYHMGENALPFIRSFAWGEYDWTQGNAIELLIRVASDGVRRAELIDEITENYPKIRYEAQLYAIQRLIPKLNENKELRMVFEELMKIPDFKDTYEEITEKST